MHAVGRAALSTVAALALTACALTPVTSGRTLARDLKETTHVARTRVARGDTAGALRLLSSVAQRTATGTERDLVHGHIAALENEATLLAELAALRAAHGDTAAAHLAFDRLLFEGGYRELLDSLEQSPYYHALNATAEAPRWRQVLRQYGRTWRDSAFVSPYRDTLTLTERVSGVALIWAEARYSFVGLGQQGVANWDSAYTATVTRVTKPMDTWEYYQEIERLLYLLDDDHTGLYQLPPPLRRHRSGIPLENRRVDGHVIITEVRSPSLARLGVQVGQEVVTIDGLTPERHVAQRVPAQLAARTPQARETTSFGWQLWLGDSGTVVTVQLRDPDGTIRDVALHRGGWVDQQVRPPVEARLLGNGIGLLALNTFGDPRASQRIDSALATLGPIRGLIVDTRRNSGGSQDAGWHLLSQFMTRPFVQVEQYSSAYVGIWRAWGGLAPRVPIPERIVTPDPKVHRSYPVLWLIGPRTASAAEGVAALAEQTGVATTVGEMTFGSTGQPILVPLPGGGVARVRTEEERFNDGRSYTHRGITPQVTITVTADALRSGRDEVLEGAMALMQRKLSGAAP